MRVGVGAEVTVTRMRAVGDTKLIEESDCAGGVASGGEGAQAVPPIITRSIKPEYMIFRFKGPSFRSN
jgi:hypothetical protein